MAEPTTTRPWGPLDEIFSSGRPLAYVRTAEEARVASLLRAAAAEAFPSPVPLWVWSLTEGMRRDGSTDQAEPLGPREALEFVDRHDGPGLFLLKDFHEPIRNSPEIRRRLRDLYETCVDRGKFVIVCSPVRELPDELANQAMFVALPIPGIDELTAFARAEAETVMASGGTADTSDGALHQVARALQGLTLDEARHAIRRARSMRNALDTESLPALLEEKRSLVNRTGIVEFLPSVTGIDDIGGLEIMKKWLLDRRKLFQMRDELSAEIVPKGVLVMGISGCGKSLAIKAISSTFDLPLYRIDMVEVFSGLYGKPESAFARACHLLESIAPAVAWFDEIEAGISTQSKEGELGRMFGFFLTWMQEKTRGLFVGATANRIDVLPAEMIRKGRFDEVFFVDLPLDEERLDIFRVHLRRRGIDASGFNLEPLRKFTKGWTGAEIEQCVVSALTTARLQDRELTDKDLLDATANVVPLSKTMKEQVDHIRGWAFDRAVRASPRDTGR
jgi:ATP-dependent 26S proteasome regulatory subunit